MDDRIAAGPDGVVEGVLFDAGGTLVQLHTDRLSAELRARGHDPHELDSAFWQAMALLDERYGPDAGEWGDWFPQWLEGLAATSRIPRAVMRDAWHAADERLHLWDQPVQGAAECLARLRDAGLRVGVVSNADGRIEESLQRAGLREHLEVVVDSGLVGVAKPDPAIFAYALEPLGLRPERTWYLGDTIAYDAAGADAAGLVSWLIDHRGLHTQPHPRRLTSLASFADAAVRACNGRADTGRARSRG